MPPPTGAPAPESAAKSPTPTLPKGCGIGCLGVIAIVIAFVVYAVVSGGGSSGGEATAFINCQDAVRLYFKNPAGSHIKLSEANIQHDADGWTITGPATAKNDFGVDKSFYYTCHTDSDGVVTSATVR
jgi:hypothetical protein